MDICLIVYPLAGLLGRLPEKAGYVQSPEAKKPGKKNFLNVTVCT